MLIEADAKGLEVVGAGYLSQDQVLMQELWDKVNIHENNRVRFGLPERRIAKIFVFRLLYGGSKWSYALDPDFNFISKDPAYWQGIIDEYYKKYQGIEAWHNEIVDTVEQTGKLVMPTGRVYEYQPYLKRGEYVWPRTQILNYPVQGLGHDLMAIARVSAYKRLSRMKNVLFVNSVHDSIVVDTPTKNVYNVCTILEKCFTDIPKNFERVFGVEFNCPMEAEIKYGPNWKDTKIFTREDF